MDNNNSNQQQDNPTVPVMPNPVVSTGPAEPQIPQAQPPTPTLPIPDGAHIDPPKSGNKIILLAAIAFIMFLIVVVIYLFALQNNAPKETPVPTPVPTVILTPTPTPTQTLDENNIDAVEIIDPEVELKTIDEDVKQL